MIGTLRKMKNLRSFNWDQKGSWALVETCVDLEIASLSFSPNLWERIERKEAFTKRPWLPAMTIKCTHLKFNIAPEDIPSQKERIVFQPSFFRGNLAVKLRGCTSFPWCFSPTDLAFLVGQQTWLLFLIGKPPFLIGDTSSNGGFPIAMFVYLRSMGFSPTNLTTSTQKSGETHSS